MEGARMLSVQQAITTTLEGYRRFGEAVEGLVPDELDQPTRLHGWAVRDLIAHVSWGQAMEADAARRAVAGDSTLAGADEIPADASFGALNGAVKQGFEAISSALPDVADLDPASSVVIPAGTLPLPGAITLFALEAGLHASDLSHALGGPGRLSTDEVAACLALTRPLMGLSAGRGAKPEPGSSIRLVGESLGDTWTAHGTAWAPGEGEAATTVSGTDEAIALFVYGRIDHDDHRLSVSGNSDTAARFKEFFPGP